MRRIDFIISKVRKDTNNISPNRFNDLDIGTYLTNAQKQIQTVAVNANIRNGVFSEELIFPLVTNQEAYELPPDIFSRSSIDHVSYAGVEYNNQNRNYWKMLPSLTDPERDKSWGYIVRNDKIMVSPIPTGYTMRYIRMIYVRKLYEVGPRYGKITSFTPGAPGVPGNIVFDLLLQDDKQLKITDYFDYISVVDKDGKFGNKGIFIENLQMDVPAVGQATITVSETEQLQGVATGEFVIGGSRTTSHSELPDVCEQLLTNVAERFISFVDSSKDINNASILTSSEENMIMDLFKNHTSDNPYPPIVDGTYLNL